MRKVLYVLLILVLFTAPLFAQGAKASAKDSDQLHFVYVSPLLAHPVWLMAKDGFDQAVKELGIRGDWVGPQGISPEEMAKLVETATAQKVDAIITQGLVPAAPVQAAIDAGIPALIVDSPIDLTGELAYFGKDVDVQAKAIYDHVVATMGNRADLKVSIQVAALNYKIAVDQIEAIENAFANYGGTFKIVNISESKSDRMRATTEWENTFKAYPEVNVSINLAAEAGPAAASVVQEMGIKNRVRIYAVDDLDETLDWIREGGIDGTVATSFFNYGYQAAFWLYQHITEGKVPAQVNNDAGTILITNANIDSYKQLMKVKVDL